MCLRHFHHGIDHAAGVRTGSRIVEKPVLSANCKRTNLVFTEIVCKAAASIFQIGLSSITPVHDLIHCFLHAGVSDGFLLLQPRKEDLQNGLFLLETKRFPLFMISRMQEQRLIFGKPL